MSNSQRGAIHFLSLFIIGLLCMIFFMAASALGHVDRLEARFSEQEKTIQELQTKIKILEVREGL